MVSPAPDRLGLLLRRTFSLSGVVPLGAFVVFHAAVVASALDGARSFAAVEDTRARWPGLAVLEALLIYLPLLAHGLIGVWLVATRRRLVEPSPYPRYPVPIASAMRWTGVGLGAFLVLHVIEVRFRGARAAGLDGAMEATTIAADLSATWHGVPLWGLAYLVGGALVAFHLAVGVWGFFAASERGRANAEARRRVGWAAAIVAAALWATLADVTVLQATGKGIVGDNPTEPREPCPAP